MVNSPSSAHVLAHNLYSSPIPHQPADQVVSGEPTTGIETIGSLGGLEVGIWEMTPGTVRDTEVDEVFIVLTGAGELAFEDGSTIPLSPGVAVQLRAGELTTWRVTETLRKVWIG